MEGFSAAARGDSGEQGCSDQGMEEMAAKFRETGSELYMGAGGGERD